MAGGTAIICFTGIPLQGRLLYEPVLQQPRISFYLITNLSTLLLLHRTHP